MKTIILQEFKGKINNIEINDKNTFYSTEYILEKIEEKFGECYNDEFIKKLALIIERAEFKFEYFDRTELENEFVENIDNANTFKDIQFTYCGSDWKFEVINEEIKNGKFEIDNSLEN